MPLSVSMLALPGTMPSVLFGAFDVLSGAGVAWHRLSGNAGMGEALFTPRIVARDAAPVSGFNGVEIRPACAFAEIARTDIVFVPPLWLEPGEGAFRIDARLRAWLRDMAMAGTVMTAACTGSLVLAAAGLLDGRRATTHWAFAQTVRREFPAVQLQADKTLVEADGRPPVITAGGHVSWQALLLHLIRRAGGAHSAAQAARAFLLHAPELDQRVYANCLPQVDPHDAAMRESRDWLEAHHADPQALEQARSRSGLSARGFARRFRQASGVTPIAYLQAVRLEAARTLLVATGDPVESIADTVGYADVSFFRRLFKRHTGMTPAAYRRRMQLPQPG